MVHSRYQRLGTGAPRVLAAGLFCGLVLLAAGGCALLGGRWYAVEWEDDLGIASLRRAVEQSLRFAQAIPEDRPVGRWPREITAAELRRTLVAFRELIGTHEREFHSPSRLRNLLRARFDLHPAATSNHRAVFTGYYRPVLDASFFRTDIYRYPIYRKPDDLPGVEPSGPAQGRGWFDEERPAGSYYSRYEIDELGKLTGRGYEMAWVKDPVDLFFLHVQGSGLLRMADGRLLQLGFAASNGRPYTSIGRILIERGEMTPGEMSMQGLRRFLRDHPEKRAELFSLNERYIFFRLAEEGPLGNLSVPLTAGRSIATDPSYYPRGALAFISTRIPEIDEVGRVMGWRPLQRFVLNQDTGAAIKGPGRVDIYFGTGERAGAIAGRMKEKGRLFFLLEKPPAEAANAG